MLAIHLERDLELQVAYFTGHHQLEDVTTMFLHCGHVDTWAKEAVKPSDQRVGIERAADKPNDVDHANSTSGVRCKYGVTDLWCMSVAEYLCPLLARNGSTEKMCTQLRRRVDSRKGLMDLFLLCNALRLLL
ncbi:Glutamine synthetase [Hordeum vulgare]|nr:Glutamine synthetase [Hordeum vulgare]